MTEYPDWCSVVSTETFNHDAAGNVTSAPDSSFQYDTNNRLTVFNGNSVSYDLDGKTQNDFLDTLDAILP